MKDVYIKRDELNYWIRKYLPNKDLVSIDEILDVIENMDYKIESLKKKIKNLEENIQNNYVPISASRQYGVSDADFL